MAASDDQIKYTHLTSRYVEGKLPDRSDKVMVKDLQVIVNAGVDVWGRQKSQPALVSLTLNLSRRFESAAETDKVDHGTVHYGELSKDVLAMVAEQKANWIDTRSLAFLVYDRVQRNVKKSESKINLSLPKLLLGCEIEIHYPKGTMFGDGASYIYSFRDEEYSEVLHLKNVKLPCLIGVNDNERERQQPVVANVWMDAPTLEPLEAKQSGNPDLHALAEEKLSKIIMATSFETLEALAAHVIKHLQQDIRYYEVRLRLEKPVAVPLAAAPAIEVVRGGQR